MALTDEQLIPCGYFRASAVKDPPRVSVSPSYLAQLNPAEESITLFFCIFTYLCVSQLWLYIIITLGALKY